MYLPLSRRLLYMYFLLSLLSGRFLVLRAKEPNIYERKRTLSHCQTKSALLLLDPWLQHTQSRISTVNPLGADLQALVTGFELGSTLYADLLLTEGDFLLWVMHFINWVPSLGTWWCYGGKNTLWLLVCRTLKAQFSDSRSSANRMADSSHTGSACDRHWHIQ